MSGRKILQGLEQAVAHILGDTKNVKVRDIHVEGTSSDVWRAVEQGDGTYCVYADRAYDLVAAETTKEIADFLIAAHADGKI